ncbi:hypothetical protein [Glutamicibacter protophormiae]|uniref:Terminase small subunit n=1 Tax=Glutamicibacter protophormiae TaxID=37930 RepID=A0ABS4XQW6_GLUPR|nr:hypothetical protein [Glutamicibacter protophormiae]MBP2398896.1 hypothetical protein [Glutamicibacter protophormiae]GGL83425.1 hypothetical protein GCM10010038_11640 [Glutamicibacter protophormiae]
MNHEPAGLGERGARVFRSLTKDETSPMILETAIEAARAADRLDDLDRAIQGEGVLDLMRAALEDNGVYGGEHKITIKLQFSGVLMEGRQQQDNFRKLIAEVARLKTLGKPKTEGATPAPEAPKVDNSTENELDKRRKARERARKHG